MQRSVTPLTLALVAALALLLGGGHTGNRTAAAQTGPWVTLYAELNYGGTSMMFRGDVLDLRTTVLNDQASSLKLSPGAVVTLFEHTNYQGRCQAFSADTVDLRGTTIGNDTASSLRLDTRSWCGGPWVNLYTNTNYGGAVFSFTGDVADFTKTPGLNDAASSLIVNEGTLVALYSGANYGGVCQEFTLSAPNLQGTPIGNDTAGSLRIGAHCPPPAQTSTSKDLTVQLHLDPGPTVDTFNGKSVRDLKSRYDLQHWYVVIGVEVFQANTRAALFTGPDFTGDCHAFGTGVSFSSTLEFRSLRFNEGCPGQLPVPPGGLNTLCKATVAWNQFPRDLSRCLSFGSADIPDLSAHGFNNSAVALYLSTIGPDATSPSTTGTGWTLTETVVTLFAHTQYQGTCQLYRVSQSGTVGFALGQSAIGANAVSSIRMGDHCARAPTPTPTPTPTPSTCTGLAVLLCGRSP